VILPALKQADDVAEAIALDLDGDIKANPLDPVSRPTPSSAAG
jgi:hypothetical protein